MHIGFDIVARKGHMGYQVSHMPALHINIVPDTDNTNFAKPIPIPIPLRGPKSIPIPIPILQMGLSSIPIPIPKYGNAHYY